jgi:hypothetical protein
MKKLKVAFFSFSASMALILLVIFMYSFCFKKPAHQKDSRFSLEEQNHLEAFFRRLIIQENGAYTLLGSKPMTSFQITGRAAKDWLKTLSVEEKKRAIIVVSKSDTNSSWFKNLPEETRKRALFAPLLKGDFLEGFSIAKKKLKMKKFLLFKGKSFCNPNEEAIYFINIIQTFLVLRKNYQTFKDAIDADFSPLDLIFDLSEGGNELWDKILARHELLGILFGFGPENSWIWSMRTQKSSLRVKNFKKSIFEAYRVDPKSLDFKAFTNPKIKNLGLPGFVSFFAKDPVLEKYKQQQNEIKKQYAFKNFLKTTLRLLESDFGMRARCEPNLGN